MNIPNFLTGLRLAAVPVFVILFLRGKLGAALGVFVGAMITDWLDGVAARVLKHQHYSAVIANQSKRYNCTRRVEPDPERIFMLEPSKGPLRRLFRQRRNNKDVARFSFPLAPV